MTALEERKAVLDEIAKLLHPHWRGDRHTYIAGQLPGMVRKLIEERDDARRQLGEWETLHDQGRK